MQDNLLSPPLQTLIEAQTKIEAWFDEQWKNHRPLFSSSVDLRNAGFKIAPVDTNLTPAGFNNLSADAHHLCVQAARDFLNSYYPHNQKILIVAENHTRNKHYHESLFFLHHILSQAGYACKIGSFLDTPLTLSLEPGEMTILPVKRNPHQNEIFIENFIPDLILLNNDLSEGIPAILNNLSQPIEPPLHLGWSVRSKTRHFEFYQQVCENFCKSVHIDPWHISALFVDCGKINFLEKSGTPWLLEKSIGLIRAIQEKYTHYALENKPFVVIKADAGTYGMAVMSLSDPNTLLSLNRKQRTKMSVRKGNMPVDQVIIQEGVYTIDLLDQVVAEPVVYMIGQQAVGGFYRAHPLKKHDDNLNTPGMFFKTFACAHSTPLCYVYSVIARLAQLASCLERENPPHAN